MALTEIILAIANVIFIIVAIFLFVRLRKMGKKCEPERQQQAETAGITNVAPAEFKPEKFEIKSQDIAPHEKPAIIAPDIGAVKTELRLEDELPEVKEKTAKKESKKKKAAKKVLEEVIEQAIKKETGAPSEEILIPATKEEKPEKKESKKKKPAKKEPEKVAGIKEETGAPLGKILIPEKIEFKFEETMPEKEEKPWKIEGKKKKPSEKDKIVEEAAKEKAKAPLKKKADKKKVPIIEEPQIEIKAEKGTVKETRAEEKQTRKTSKKKIEKKQLI